VGLKTVSDRDEVMLITEKGMIVRSPVKDIRTTGRSTQGVRLMKLDSGDKVSSVARIVPEEEEEEKMSSPAAPVPAAAGAVSAEKAPEKSAATADKKAPPEEKKREIKAGKKSSKDKPKKVRRK
jgi:DNA gyrase subunit A